MSAETIIKYLNNKKTLFLAVALFILPFIIFSFWNFPSADDYMIIDKKNQFTFWQLQTFIYQNWTGRYFATFISSIFSYSGFLYSHYYLHSILLLALTVLSWLFCLIQINKYFLSAQLSLPALALLSTLLLIAEINVIPEPVTAFYWFSSAVTYQLPLVIVIFLAGIIIKLLFAPFKIIHFITAALLIILLNGCNEIITLFVLINSTVIIGYHLLKHKKLSAAVICLFLINIISACFLWFSPGISNRGTLINHGSFFSAISVSIVKFLIINWFFLKEPLWWLLLFFIIIFITNNNDLFRHLFDYFKKITSRSLLLFYVAGGLIVYIPVLYITNGSLPLRAENMLCFLSGLLLLIIVSTCISRKINTSFAANIYRYRYLLFSVLIFCTANMKLITQSLLSGYFYNHIMNERLAIFKNAQQQHIHEVTFDDYETAVGKIIKAHFPAANRQVLRDIIAKPPPIICFKTDLYDMNFVKEFYGIRKLSIRN